MQAFAKTLVCVVLAAVVTAPLSALDFRPDVASHARIGECHLSTNHDGGSVPAPQPARHSCCQGAHHPAILLQNSRSQPSLEALAQIESIHDASAKTAFHTFPSFLLVSSGPPPLSPLRV
ncbi:MAG: hypothetical protein ABSA29_09390 [Terriglobales bacterium]|jgi:hypothetical protein